MNVETAAVRSRPAEPVDSLPRSVFAHATPPLSNRAPLRRKIENVPALVSNETSK
jgi:hypothetical protein